MMKYTLGLYEKAMPDRLSWEHKLAACGEAGFDFLEISIDESDFRLSRLDYSKDERFGIIRSTRETGIYIDTMCLSGHRKFPIGSGVKETEEAGMRIMSKAIELAYDIGVRIIQLAAYDVYYNEVSTAETGKRFTENLLESARIAAKNGVILALETMENDFCNTITKAMRFVDATNSPYLKIYPDIGNVSNATKNVTEDIMNGSGNIVAAHLKETVPGVYRNMKFGTGDVDFASAVKALNKANVTKYNAEFWYDGNDDWQNQLKAAYEFLSPILNNEFKEET
ncbi:MAG: L-ribulose-5-phosphate 3-epimerase [Saccharofermentanales bacterium]